MVQIKRKAISKIATGAKIAAKHGLEEEAVVTKKPAAAKKEDIEAEDEHDEDADMENEEDEGEEEEEEPIDEAEALLKKEADTMAERTKELKAMYMDDLKSLLASKGLETGKKEEMIKALVAFEAKERAEVRQHEANIREVVVKKKEELEAKSAPELKELCAAIGLKGVLSKPERVERLLAQWQQEDGVDKALAQKATDVRKEALVAMEPHALKRICEKAGVDPLLKEVMVDRIMKREIEMGKFTPAAPKPEEKQEKSANSAKKVDVVAAVLANEAERKKDKELKKKQEDEAASKKKELRAMSLDELKKLLSKKGMETVGKKDDLVEALFAKGVQEEAAAAQKADLKALGAPQLKELLASKGLASSGKKDDMVEAVLAHEVKTREDLLAYEAKIFEVSAKVKAELEEKTAAELKDLCANKGVKLGSGKEDRVLRLLEEAQKDGELDKIIANEARVARKEALSAMTKSELMQLCDEIGADPLVKDIMIERLLAHEAEAGVSTCDAEEPVAKKSKKTAK